MRPRLHVDRQHAAAARPLPGFETVNRCWDHRRRMFAAKLLPGEYYVTVQREMITTVLGSCVSACVRDAAAGVGGMNHFLLPAGGAGAPDARQDTMVNAATRYGNHAMEHLINAVLRHGGRRGRLEVKLFGGARVLASMTDVGDQNVRFVREYLRTEGLAVASEDLGDVYPRRLLYFPESGRVRVKKLRSAHTDAVLGRESRYLRGLRHEPVAADVDLFLGGRPAMRSPVP